VNGVLYVAYGGHVGDCGLYHGWVVAVNAKDPTQKAAWATAGSGEAIWASGGMASDGNGVFAVTGNRNGGGGNPHQDSEEVVHVTGMAQVNRQTGIYFPAIWRTMDSMDADFGSSSPVVISVPNSTPSTIVAAVSKDGHLYLLNPANLGGMDGHLQDLQFAGQGNDSMRVRAAPAAYVSTTGVHIVLNVMTGGPCGRGILSMPVSPGSPPTAKVDWCVNTSSVSSPIATSTDGKAETIVWFMNGSTLNGVDGDTGKVVVNANTNTCSGIQAWTSPIAVKGRIIAGGDGHLCSWSAH
jgi:hypothetical protein